MNANVIRPKAKNEPITDLYSSVKSDVVKRENVPTRPIPVAEISIDIAPSFLFIIYSDEVFVLIIKPIFIKKQY